MSACIKNSRGNRKNAAFLSKNSWPTSCSYLSLVPRGGRKIPDNEPKKFKINCGKKTVKAFSPTHLESHILPFFFSLRKRGVLSKYIQTPPPPSILNATCFSWFGFGVQRFLFFSSFFLVCFSVLSYVYDESCLELLRTTNRIYRYFCNDDLGGGGLSNSPNALVIIIFLYLYHLI